jgi:hypothetical protein
VQDSVDRPSSSGRLVELLATLEDMSEDERIRFLDVECVNAPELRRRILEILAHESEAQDFIDSTATSFDPAALGVPVTASHHTREREEEIGPYRIVDVLDEGGMGTVYLAEQETPVRRQVALKVVKFGMDTNEVIARFEAERQALALMSHPNIAQVHDAGSTEKGRPYFVMEHVPGRPYPATVTITA